MQQNDTIDPFVLFSMRQVVGGCLDWVQEALKIVLEEYLRDGNPPLNPKFDLSIVNQNFASTFTDLLASLTSGT